MLYRFGPILLDRLKPPSEAQAIFSGIRRISQLSLWTTLFLTALVLSPITSVYGEDISGLQSESISGTGTTNITSQNDHVKWQGNAIEYFSVQANAMEVTLYHADYHSVDPLISSYDDYGNETHRYPGINHLSLGRSDPETEILVEPSRGHNTDLVNHGGFVGYPVDKKSIMWDKHSEGGPATHSYKVDVESTNGFEFYQETEVVVEGNFTLYVWEADLMHRHDEGMNEYETGFTQTSTGPGDALSSDHYTYAKIAIIDGILRFEVNPQQPDLHLYSSEITSSSDQPITYGHPEGTISILDGLLFKASPEEDLIVNGGTSIWTYGSEKIHTTFHQPPTEVTGGSIIEDDPADKKFATPAAMIPLIAGGLLVALVAGAITAPNFVGKKERPDGSWRQKRAKGYLLLATRAKEHNRLRLAGSMLRLSKRNNRWDPACTLLIATIHSDRGDQKRELRARRRAHHMLTAEGLPDPDKVADNAYKAARAAAMLEMKDRALHWLKIAISYNPELGDEARWEVDFDLISLEPEFKVLMGERVDLGWNPPST